MTPLRIAHKAMIQKWYRFWCRWRGHLPTFFGWGFRCQRCRKPLPYNPETLEVWDGRRMIVWCCTMYGWTSKAKAMWAPTARETRSCILAVLAGFTL